MKILEVSSCFPPSRGGVERCVHELSTRFAEHGHEVTVVTSTRGKSPKYHSEILDGLRVIRYPERYHLFEAPLVPMIATSALTMDYDVIHIHGMSPTITDFSILLARLRRKPIVVTYHNDAETEQMGRITKLAAFVYSSLAAHILCRADVVVSSTRSYAHTSPSLRYCLGKLRVIPMGVDAKKYERIHEVAGEGVIDEESSNILFVGQLKDYKGVEVLLEALYLLRSEGHLVKANIVGTGPQLENLKKQTVLLGMNNAVTFWGNIHEDQLLRLYAKCDTFVLPSLNRREAFGIVLLEAMAAGRTVVASDIPGVNEVALKGNGYLAPPNDAESLARSILESIRNKRHPDLMRKVAQDHTWDKLAFRYESIFESLLERRGRRNSKN